MDTAETHLARLVEADDPDAAAAELRAAVGEQAARDLAVSWGRSHDPDVRSAALDLLLAVLNAAWEVAPDVGPDPEVVRLVVEQAGSVSTGDQDEHLRWRAARALGNAAGLDGGEQAAQRLLRFADDEDSEVRFQVSFYVAISIKDDAVPDDPAVGVLVRLLSDPDPGVRDMSSFAFTISSVDSPIIRDELLTLSATSEEPAAGQAGAALARRGDARVLPIALSKLARDDVCDLWVWDVVHTHPSRAFLPALLRLRQVGWTDRPGPGITYSRDFQQELLDRAIVAARSA